MIHTYINFNKIKIIWCILKPTIVPRMYKQWDRGYREWWYVLYISKPKMIILNFDEIFFGFWSEAVEEK